MNSIGPVGSGGVRPSTARGGDGDDASPAGSFAAALGMALPQAVQPLESTGGATGDEPAGRADSAAPVIETSHQCPAANHAVRASDAGPGRGAANGSGPAGADGGAAAWATSAEALAEARAKNAAGASRGVSSASLAPDGAPREMRAMQESRGAAARAMARPIANDQAATVAGTPHRGADVDAKRTLADARADAPLAARLQEPPAARSANAAAAADHAAARSSIAGGARVAPASPDAWNDLAGRSAKLLSLSLGSSRIERGANATSSVLPNEPAASVPPNELAPSVLPNEPAASATPHAMPAREAQALDQGGELAPANLHALGTAARSASSREETDPAENARAESSAAPRASIPAGSSAAQASRSERASAANPPHSPPGNSERHEAPADSSRAPGIGRPSARVAAGSRAARGSGTEVSAASGRASGSSGPAMASQAPDAGATPPALAALANPAAGSVARDAGEIDPATGAASPLTGAPEAAAEVLPGTPQGTDRVTVSYVDADGAAGRIRLSVRGDAVRATIVSDHAPAAHGLAEDLGALRRGLAERGFSDSNLTVQSSIRSAPAARSTAEHRAGDDRERRATAQDSSNRRPRQRTPRDSAER